MAPGHGSRGVASRQGAPRALVPAGRETAQKGILRSLAVAERGLFSAEKDIAHQKPAFMKVPAAFISAFDPNIPVILPQKPDAASAFWP